MRVLLRLWHQWLELHLRVRIWSSQLAFSQGYQTTAHLSGVERTLALLLDRLQGRADWVIWTWGSERDLQGGCQLDMVGYGTTIGDDQRGDLHSPQPTD